MSLPLPKFYVTDKVTCDAFRFGFGYVTEMYSSAEAWVYEVAHNDRASEDETTLHKEQDLRRVE